MRIAMVCVIEWDGAPSTKRSAWEAVHKLFGTLKGNLPHIYVPKLFVAFCNIWRLATDSTSRATRNKEEHRGSNCEIFSLSAPIPMFSVSNDRFGRCWTVLVMGRHPPAI